VDGFSSVDLNSIAASPIQSQTQRRHPAMDAAAKLLGMSTTDLRKALQSGQSLASLASSKGITQDALTSAMATAIEQANPNVTADQATKLATQIATRTRPTQPPAQQPATQDPAATDTTGTTATQGHHHHHHHGGAAAMDAASKLLGMSTTDLTSALQSGQSLTSIASSKGVSQSDLVNAMATALQGANSNLTTDQATDIATRMATQTPGTQNQPWASGSQEAPSTFSITA
jgi:uncharacterized protein YidB (DUF937 family)